MGLEARVTGRGRKLRLMLTWMIVLIFLVQGLAGPVASAAQGSAHALGEAALPPDVAGLGATAGWWAEAQTRIQQDLSPSGTDGLSTTPDWEDTGEQVDDLFGFSVASAGDVDGDGYADVIVGAPGIYGTGKEGRAYVFFGSATGLATSPGWSQSGENEDDSFGFSVAGAGDVNGDGYADVIVGARNHAAAGRAYVFLGSAAGPGTSPLQFDGATGSYSFGFAVAGAGDVNGDGYADILVSDRGYNSSTGRVYIYHGGASGPDAKEDQILNGQWSQDWFGHSVSSAGDVNGDGYADVIIGAIGYDNLTSTQAGAAYVYHGGTGGVDERWDWRQHGTSKDDWFGTSVAGAGDVNGDGYADVIVGAKYQGNDNPGDWHRGAAYVYHGSADGLNDLVWNWLAVGENDADRFGVSVAGAGDVNGDGYADVIVGAEEFGADEGRAYVYLGGIAGLASDPAWTDDGESSGSYFGGSVAGAGDVNGDGYADVAAGARGYSSDTGKTYVYHGGGGNPGHDDQWAEEGVNTGDWFGFAVAGAGDVNGDGYSDVIVGAQQFDASRGQVYVYLGAEDGLPAFPDWNVGGENGNDWFGGSVAGAGDVNGDGYADVIVGARGYDDGSNNEAGKVYLYYGGASGMNPAPWVAVGEATNSEFGTRVAGAGDVNGDGYGDIMVSAPRYDTYRGKVYVYYGSENGPATSADRTYQGANSWENFGYGMAGVGDTNGDGYADVAVGAYGYPVVGGSPQRQGRVELFVGTETGLSAISVWTGLGENDGDNFGKTVAGAGDVDGDGCGDILVGADGFGGLRGKAYLYQGGCGGSLSQVWTGQGNQGLDAFGSALSGAGDVNGDGFADLIVGAFQSPANGLRGSAHLYNGPLSGTSYAADWEELGENTGDRFGISVAGAGDVNGDGYADVLVGANTYDSSRGKVYAYFGNDGGGRRVLTQQKNSDRTDVQPWGLVNATDRFEAWLWASDPSGRGRLKLQAEACPPGAGWGDAACTMASGDTWEDLFLLSSPASQRRLRLVVRGMDSNTLYRWRARVLYAPYSVLRVGITPPPKPAHGPWRRIQAQAFEADLRTLNTSCLFLPVVVRNH